MKFNPKHVGSSFEEWLEEEGILEETTSTAIKSVLAWQLAQEMKRKKLTKQKMALAMNYAVQAGRLAYHAGRMPKRLYASASSPLTGLVTK